MNGADLAGKNTCPHCASDLTGPPIPQEYIDKGYYAPGATHYSRLIGHEIQGVYDGILFWVCPDCSKAWARFDWPVAHRYVKSWNEGNL